MPRYTYDHVNLRTADPAASAEYYKTMFGADVIESVQSDGQSRIDRKKFAALSSTSPLGGNQPSKCPWLQGIGDESGNQVVGPAQ